MWVSFNVDCKWFSLLSYVNFTLLDWFIVIQFINQVNQVFFLFGIALPRMKIKYGRVMQLSSLNYTLSILWVSYNGYRPLVMNFFSNKSSMTFTVHKKNKMFGNLEIHCTSLNLELTAWLGKSSTSNFLQFECILASLRP